MRTDGQTATTQLIVSYRNVEDAPKKNERLTHTCVMLGTAKWQYWFPWPHERLPGPALYRFDACP